MPVVSGKELDEISAANLGAFDVCIIGSGPAGSTLARELSHTPLRVILLESGGFERSTEADGFDEIESVGYPRQMDQWRVRNRIVGGSSHTWTGRCAAFDEIDFQERSWVPNSGWPFDLSTLEPYLIRTAPYLGLAVGYGFSDDRFWALSGRPRPQIAPAPSHLLPFFWQFSRDDTNPFEYMRFGRQLVKNVGANVTLVTHATVQSINPDLSGRSVRSVDVALAGGRRHCVSANTVILCAGAIENSRLLLASDGIVQGGLGNGRDLVGRYLMDHPRGGLATFDLEGSEQLQKRFGLYKVRGNLFRAGLRLSPDVQRAEGLLNCAVWLGETLAADDPWHAVKRVLRRTPNLPDDFLVIAKNAGLFARGLKEYFVDRNGLPRKLEGLTLDGMCEQLPDPESRVTLSDRRDGLGMRLSRINWRIHPEEARSMRRTAELAVTEFARIGLPVPTLDEWVRDGADFPPTVTECAHPTGTTRMATDPAKGVVGADLEVHGVEGLYVVGSSVFPTAGHCNPTQMIVALAIRLADRVKEASRVRVGSITRTETLPGERPMILVTGATGHIGRFVIDHLIAHGFRVRATTSKMTLPPDKLDGSIQWRRVDLREGGPSSSDLEHCVAVIHLAAEMTNTAYMRSVNVEGTFSLAQAAEKAGVRVFVYASSVAVYGNGRHRDISEDAPVLTVDRDVKSEFWAVSELRAYGRTKLGGEISLKRAASSMQCVVFRPTVVVDTDKVMEVREWSAVKRHIAAYRHAHHINVRDVADAFLWAVKRGLGNSHEANKFEVYNLSEDEFAESTYAEFMRKAYKVSGNASFRTIVLPWIVDWLRNVLKFRTFAFRHPAGRMRFRCDRLHAAGWQVRFGLAALHSDALSRFAAETGALARSEDTRSA